MKGGRTWERYVGRCMLRRYVWITAETGDAGQAGPILESGSLKVMADLRRACGTRSVPP